MQEKEMMNDVLTGLKSSIANYGRVISECDDENLRRTIQQIRNDCEQYQWQMAKLAEQKNYYQPAEKATDQQVQTVRSQVSPGGAGGINIRTHM